MSAGIESFGVGWVVCVFSQSASLLMHRCAKKCGRGERKARPRGLMAAKFTSAHDPTGEATLKHWIAQGQIQDPTPSLLNLNS